MNLEQHTYFCQEWKVEYSKSRFSQDVAKRNSFSRDYDQGSEEWFACEGYHYTYWLTITLLSRYCKQFIRTVPSLGFSWSSGLFWSVFWFPHDLRQQRRHCIYYRRTSINWDCYLEEKSVFAYVLCIGRLSRAALQASPDDCACHSGEIVPFLLLTTSLT